jgi:hypothetical protein
VRNLHPPGTVFLNVTSRSLLAASLAGLTACAIGGSACVVSVEHKGQIEHVDKRYTVGKAPVELRLTTFDGAIEVRSWDRPEVLVQIEKRGQDKDALAAIEIIAEQKGDVIQVETRTAKATSSFGIGYVVSTSAKLVASVPRNTNLLLRTSDGSVIVERVTGKAEIHTGDGSIRATETAGEMLAETADGSIQIEDVAGRVEARTNDGSIRLSGTPTSLRARSGDGSISLRIRDGASMTDDWMIATGDGSISLELPQGFAAQIEADPGSDGRVRNDLKLANVVGGDREKRMLTGALGEGGKHLTIRTADGTIRLTNY